MWFATFFVRYWRKWIVLHKTFKIADNFITNNAYLCIEINAHALIAFILILRDDLKSDCEYFLPWMLGAQSCEQVFRALRSMTGTFSTIVNFTMLGMLQRLHKLGIMVECQSQSGEAQGIHFPRQEKYGKRKDGYNTTNSHNSIVDISNEEIAEAMKMGLIRARECMENLGMMDILQQNECWETPTIPPHITGKSTTVQEEELRDEDDEEDDVSKDCLADMFSTSAEDIDDLVDDVQILHEKKAIDNTVKEKALQLKKVFEKTAGGIDCGIPTYKKREKSIAELDNVTSQFVKVKIDGKEEEDVYLRKRTVVWLLQDGERLSADRLMRVREKQPFTTDPHQKTTAKLPQSNSDIPYTANCIVIGDCVYSSPTKGSRLVGFCNS